MTELRPFQKEVLKHLHAGRCVILQAPTGAGKTRAALDPFLQNLAQQGDALPHTCRYVVPMRVLANQFFHDYDAYMRRLDAHAHTQLTQRYASINRSIASVQTGEQRDDAQFESALTFCTVDQVLASALAIPYGVSNSMANINVGAILSSYLVFDEFHLYPLGQDGKSVFGARTTVLQLLRLLKPLTPFVLMTATFSSRLLAKLAHLLDAEIVTVTDEELVEIAQGRTRTFSRSAAPMDAAALLSEHTQRANKCTLVVCNTVLRAQTLYLSLRHAEAHGTRVILLHSRFTKADRARLSQEVEDALGPAQWNAGHYLGPNIIVIATQVVEVGLNISVAVLHTENAPANSLVQRAGRCARFAQQQGRVVVYPLPPNTDGDASSTLPYDRPVCEATWAALADFDGRIVGFREEQDLIDIVHTEEDTQLLAHYEENEGLILDSIFTCLREGARDKAPELIRNVAQVQVLIHDDPNAAITKDPWQWESFGLRPTTFNRKGRWEWMQEQVQQHAAAWEDGWACRQLTSHQEQEELQDGADGLDNRQQMHIRYSWEPVASPVKIRTALLVALPSQIATYDPGLGFLFRDDFPEYVPQHLYQSSYTKREGKKDFAPSHVTSYKEHIMGLYTAYHAVLKPHLAYVSRMLEREMGLAAGTVEQAILLAIGCHDLGKLDTIWQRWAVAWQTLRHKNYGWKPYEIPPAAYCFAKTDYDSDRKKEEWKWQREVRPKRPRHACESVVIARPLLRASLGISKNGGSEQMPVLRAICGAIARHHSAQASEYKVAELSSHALHAADEALRAMCVEQKWSYDIAKLKIEIEKGDDLAPANGKSLLTIPSYKDAKIYERETWLYFVLVHALRLADQRASQ